jgi:hypothetical protein
MQAYAADVTASSLWATRVYPPIANGVYTATLTSGTTTLARSVFSIGALLPSFHRDYSLAAYDVADGRLIRFSVTGGAHGTALGQFGFNLTPMSVSLDSVTLYGFTDPLFSEPIASGTDGTIGAAAYDPATSTVLIDTEEPIEVPPNQTYYFELDGTVTPADTSYSILTSLPGDAWQAQTGTFAAVASSSNFVWSPNTFGTSSVDDADWLNGAVIPELFNENLSLERSSAPQLTCDLSVSTSTISAAGPVTLTWQSSGATQASWADGTMAPLSGTATYTVTGTRGFILNFSGPLGSTQCTALVVLAPPTAPVQNNAPATTTQPVATSTPPLAAFTVSPTSGVVPVSATIRGTVNMQSSCAAITYSMGFGDRSTTTIAVAKNLCKPLAFTTTHRYATVGTYQLRLYAGTFAAGTTTPLAATATLAVTATKTSMANPATMLAGVGAAIGGLWRSLLSLFSL